MHIKRIVKFILHKRKQGETENLAIRMRVTLSGNRPIDFPCGHTIDLAHWDNSAERATEGAVNKTNQTADEINRTLDEYRALINEVFARYELIEKRTPTVFEVKFLFNDMLGRNTLLKEAEPMSVKTVFEEYIEYKCKQHCWSSASLKKNTTVKKHFIDSSNNITITDITTDTLQQFIDYLLKCGLRNTTIQKDYKFVKYFLRWSRQKGYYSGNADLNFKLRLKGTDGKQSEIIYLTLDELKKLENCDIPPAKNYLEHVRDVFLFCCYTSLRYSDAKALKKSDIRNNIMHIITQKTVDGLLIDINNRAQAILLKYKDVALANEAALPVISNQKYNEYLKELGQLAGIDAQTRMVYYAGNTRYDEFFPKYQLLTSHCARRTFVVTALQLGIPVEVIIRWTGHSDYEAMKPYVAIVDELKKSEMSKFNNL